MDNGCTVEAPDQNFSTRIGHPHDQRNSTLGTIIPSHEEGTPLGTDDRSRHRQQQVRPEKHQSIFPSEALQEN